MTKEGEAERTDILKRRNRKTMFFKNSNSPELKFKVTDDSVSFIKSYVIPEMKLSAPIDETMLNRIIGLADDWEADMIDTGSDNYSDKTFSYPERDRNIAADRFVSEISGYWSKHGNVDFDDLNSRLGLK